MRAGVGNNRCHSATVSPGTEDESCITGFRPSLLRILVASLLTVLLAGLPLLLGRWRPRWRLLFTCYQCSLSDATRVLIVPKESSLLYVEDVKEEEVGPDFPAKYVVVPPSNSGPDDTSRLLSSSQDTFRFFVFRHLRYVWSEGDCNFVLLDDIDTTTSTHTTVSSFFNQLAQGVPSMKVGALQQLFGPNKITVNVPSYVSLLIEEVLHPFYIFQLCSMLLWSLDNYVFYAVCIFTISVLSVAVSLSEIRRQAETLHAMVVQGSEGTTTVIRPDCTETCDTQAESFELLTDSPETADEHAEAEEDKKTTTTVKPVPQTVTNSSLVPGDLVLVPAQGCVMCCDAVLITGTAIVNESMLTGESVPVTKTALARLDVANDELYNQEAHNRHTIFAGTEVIQTRYYGDQAVLAVVVRTGFSTAKGQLIRSILYPKPMDFKFYRDSIRFILLLFCVALVGMVYSTYMYIMRGASVSTIILRTLDIITIVVPPALPAAMTVGTVYAQNRLRKKGIFCISPNRINVCGKLKLVCFDKTGTLTEDGLDMWGVIPATDSSFEEPVRDIEKLDNNSQIKANMATCHSLIVIGGNLTGDPMDLKMFESTGWELEEHGKDSEKFDKMMPTVVKPKGVQQLFSMDDLPLEIGISRQFAFTSSFARMSVIVRRLGSSHFTLFCKGAPEKLEELCVEQSVPSNFHEKLRELTLAGYRVVGLASKELDVNWLGVQRMSRDQAETDLTFQGFLVMQNTLKQESGGIIRELREATLRCLMVTGDNLLTALSVARACGMVGRGDRVLVAEVEIKAGRARLCFSEAEGHSSPDQQDEVVNLEPETHLAITGRSWALLKQHLPHILPRLLVRGTVFARMSPDQKADLLEELQDIGYVAAMCGDGANDCGALKAAHVGVSLSEAEASVAAPFTSKVPNISCIPSLVLEGRCALTTSFGVFKYMALYSMIQFISVLILYSNRTNLGDTQFLYIDLIITTTVAVLMGRTGPWTTIVPKRPPGSLVSGITLASIFFQIMACLAGQLAATYYLHAQTWWSELPDDQSKEIIVDWDTTTIFIVGSYQYLSLATVFSKGPPYRKPFYTNFLYFAALVLLSLFTALLLLNPVPALGHFFQLKIPEISFRVGIFIIVAVNTSVNILLELVISTGSWVKKLSHLISRKKRPKNKYKIIEKELQESDGLDWPHHQATYFSDGLS